MHGPKEQARRISRGHFATAERVEQGHPRESRLIANWRKSAERRGEDPEIGVRDCIAHLRLLGEVYAELAEHAPDYAAAIKIKEEEERRKGEEKTGEWEERTQQLDLYKIERSWLNLQEFYNIRDGWPVPCGARGKSAG